MKKMFLLLCITALLFGCNNKKEEAKDEKMAGNTEKMSDDKNGKKDDNTTAQMPDSATRAKNWQEYMTPGDVHKMLAKSDGTWSGDITFWMAPGAPPTKSTGTEVTKMIMDGRYQESTFSGNMMGMPFSGKSLVAYDNHRKVFTTTWIDNMGTGIMIMEGTWDEATKTITSKGKAVNPETKNMDEKKQVLKIIDDNNQLMEMYTQHPDGKETKDMEIKYTRKK